MVEGIPLRFFGRHRMVFLQLTCACLVSGRRVFRQDALVQRDASAGNNPVAWMAKKEPFTSSSSSGDDARERPSESVSSSERPDALREAEADEGKAAGRPEDKTLPPPKERVKGANEADEAQWILIFRQTAGTYKAPEEWLKSFGQPMDENYSILDTLADANKGADGKFHFKIKWPERSGPNFNEWKQSSNPAKKEKVSGYEAVNVLFTANHWRGLEYNGKATLFDGSVDSTKWWYAIGTKVPYLDGMPGPEEGKPEKQTELYIYKGPKKKKEDSPTKEEEEKKGKEKGCESAKPLMTFILQKAGKAMQQAGLLAANGHQVPEVDLSTKAKECVWCPILSALKKELEQTDCKGDCAFLPTTSTTTPRPACAAAELAATVFTNAMAGECIAGKEKQQVDECTGCPKTKPAGCCPKPEPCPKKQEEIPCQFPNCPLNSSTTPPCPSCGTSDNNNTDKLQSGHEFVQGMLKLLIPRMECIQKQHLSKKCLSSEELHLSKLITHMLDLVKCKSCPDKARESNEKVILELIEKAGENNIDLSSLPKLKEGCKSCSKKVRKESEECCEREGKKERESEREKSEKGSKKEGKEENEKGSGKGSEKGIGKDPSLPLV